MQIDPEIRAWIELAARWAHVFAAILWVGSTYYFTWLDGRLTEEEERAKREGEAERPQVWMVHSGGFYVVERRKTLESLERKLHWFRWEAAATWLSGMVLLVMVYYLGGALIDADVLDIGAGAGAAISLGFLAAAWIIYDLLVLSPLGRNEKAFAVVAYVLIVAASYGLLNVFGDRAAYLHVGAMFGTIMAANVWQRILPTQRRMIDDIRQGRTPDPALGARAKLRSKHNTYMVVPAVFTMISNHYAPITHGHNYRLPILAAMILVGWLAAHLIRRA